MKYSKIAGVDKPVSKIILGTSTPAFMRGENCNSLLDCALSLGINAFDTARVYGRAEKALGRWLAAPGVRERAVVISKCCHPDIFGRRRVNARAMRADLKKSLSALGTDYIDIYLLHRDDLSVPAGTVVDYDYVVENNLAKYIKHNSGLKVLGNGELKNAITVKAAKFSESAKAAIEKAGGTAENLS